MILKEHWEVARLLMDAGAAKDQALCLASARGQAAAVQFLLDAETDIEQGNSMGETPLFLALLHGHWEARGVVEKFRHVSSTTSVPSLQ